MEPQLSARFLGPIRAHNPNSIWIGSAVFAQMTAECPYTLQWDAPFPQKKLPIPIGGSGPHLIHDPCDHQSPQPKWHLDQFGHFCRVH